VKHTETTIDSLDSVFLGISSLQKVLSAPFVDPLSRTYWLGLVLMIPISAIYYYIKRPKWSRDVLIYALKHPSTWLDIQMLIARQFLNLLLGTQAIVSAWYIATRGIRWLDDVFGMPNTPEISDGVVVFLYSMVLFVMWDLSRFLLHMCMHRIPQLWAFHQVHHSAEILTPLTFYRIHPIESWLYSIRGALVTGTVAGLFYWIFRESINPYTLWGVPAFGFVLNILFGNIRHSHVYLRFPEWVESWLFLSPAQHQQHHSVNEEHYDKNYGTWMSIWDRILGSLISSQTKPIGYGIKNSNHNHNLLSAYLKPFTSLIPIVLLFLSFPVQAEPNSLEPEESTSEPTDQEASEEEGREDSSEGDTSSTENSFATEMIVYSDDQKLRVAGSAQKVNQEQLELYEFDNIEQVLQQVPGVATRNEDGFGLRPNIGIRGANSDRSSKITLMEDGIPFAPAPYAAPAAYYFPMSTRIVGVEIFKGPAATRFGPFTIGGALNLQTRDIPVANSHSIDLAYGIRNTLKGHTWFSRSNPHFSYLLEAVHLQSDGFKELDSGGKTGFEKTEVMFKGRIPTNQGYTELKLGYAQEHSLETYLGLNSIDVQQNPYKRYVSSSMGDMSWMRTQAELTWHFKPSQNWTVHNVAYHHFLDRSWTKLNGFRDGVSLHQLMTLDDYSGTSEVYMAILKGEEDSTVQGQYLQIGTNHRVFHSYGLQSKAQLKTYGENFQSTLELGIRYHGDNVVRIHTEDPHLMQSGSLQRSDLETETILDSTAIANAVAVHIHEDLSFSKVHFFPGIRLEMVQGQRKDLYATTQDSIVRTTILPGFATLVDLGSWFDVFAGVHRGFSPVSPGQPSEVQPEQSWNYETGLRWDLGTSHAEVVGFFNDYENLLGQCSFSGGCVGETIDQQYNGGSVWIYGLESLLGVQIPVTENFTIPISGTYTVNQSSFRSDFYSSFHQFGSVTSGDALPYLAKHQASFSLGIQTGNIKWGSNLSYRSEMLDTAGIYDNDELEIPALLLVESALHLTLSDNWNVYASGTNLLNDTSITSWRPFGARTVAPRQIMFGLKKN
jgi:Fe(3+) dicitrate transport protein